MVLHPSFLSVVSRLVSCSNYLQLDSVQAFLNSELQTYTSKCLLDISSWKFQTQRKFSALKICFSSQTGLLHFPRQKHKIYYWYLFLLALPFPIHNPILLILHLTYVSNLFPFLHLHYHDLSQVIVVPHLYCCYSFLIDVHPLWLASNVFTALVLEKIFPRANLSILSL